MKGIILAGGRGSRLYPVTKSTCKQLLPIYDKPMIYYSLSVLLMAGIREILLVTTPKDRSRFEELLGDGSQWGVHIEYGVQETPMGIAECFLIGEEFIGEESVALILGDNIFYGHDFAKQLQAAKKLDKGALIFGYEVNDPERYGVMEFDQDRRVIQIIEKPEHPPSRFAVTGLYFYDNEVIEIARNLSPSKRGELEITDVNNVYLGKGKLKCHLLERGSAWLDTGTPDSMHEASNYVHILQQRQGIKIGCIEEIAYKMGFIDDNQLTVLAKAHSSSEYGKYLSSLRATSLFGTLAPVGNKG